MISQLEKKITFRYLKPKKKEGFLNIISIFSFIGISLGVAVLIIVMSVMNGFRSELANKILGFSAHIVVEPYSDEIDTSKVSSKELDKISKDIICFLEVSLKNSFILRINMPSVIYTII